ncbi:F-box protein At5g07610-like [Papaver somniferum]|uniref:F-box protein At5g07610-like n=1 Tax=Papaver somniferum TaxID=3469 RepID=UPI000E6F5172|nr:F-box protein At5g07610-like [Papaver somniferum]
MWVSSVSLAFDPQKSPYYEAIAIWGDTPDGAQAEIYSSKTESWKDLGIIGARHSHCFRDCGVYWNGALHWFNIFRGLYFDISRKLLKRLPIPDIYGESIQTYKGTNIETWNVYFGECNGHLHLIKIYGLENIPTDLYILELERDYSAWTVKYIVNIEHLTATYNTEMVLNKHNKSFKDLDFSVLFVEDNDDDEAKTSKLVMHIGEHVIFYNLKDMSFKEVEDVHLIRNVHSYHRLATPFIESLACV